MNFILTGLRPCSVTPRQSSCELKPEIAQFITLRKLGRVGEVTQQAGGMAQEAGAQDLWKEGTVLGKESVLAILFNISTLDWEVTTSHNHSPGKESRSPVAREPPSPTACSHHEKKSCITFIFKLTRTPATADQNGKVQRIQARIQHNQTWTKAVVFNLWVATPFGDWIIFS